MTSNYKRLGGYIRQVDVRNKGLKVDRLLGVSISKEFMPSIANTIGTDMSNYKVVRNGQFAYGPVTSRNGDKVSVALLQDGDAIISQAYTVFEIIDSEQLSADYLMMWFRRPEFDRYARFHSHGSAREVFDWDEMCDVMLPVPSIDRQRELVAQYESLSRRIRINEQMIATLEEAAQSLYRKMFVECIDKENLPEGWKMGTLTKIATYTNGIACQRYETNETPSYPVIKIRELGQGFTDEASNRVKTNVPQELIINNGDLIFAWSASLMIDWWNGGVGVLNQHLFKVTSENYPLWFAYHATKEHIKGWTHMISAKATSMGHIKREDLEKAEVIICDEKTMNEANCQINPIWQHRNLLTRELSTLRSLQSLLLTKLSKA